MNRLKGRGRGLQALDSSLVELDDVDDVDVEGLEIAQPTTASNSLNYCQDKQKPPEGAEDHGFPFARFMHKGIVVFANDHYLTVRFDKTSFVGLEADSTSPQLQSCSYRLDRGPSTVSFTPARTLSINSFTSSALES